MLRVAQTTEEALEVARKLASHKELSDFEIGVTGTFIEGTNKKNSPIEIVLKLKTDNKDLIGSPEIMTIINFIMTVHYYNKYEIHWLDLIEKNEEKLMEYAQENNLSYDHTSIYGRIVELTQWVGEQID